MTAVSGGLVGQSAALDAVVLGWGFPLLVAGFYVLARVEVHTRFGANNQSYTPVEVPLVVGLAFLPGFAVALASAVASLVHDLVQRRPAIKTAFNASQLLVAASLAAMTWSAVLGGREPVGPRGWIAVALAVTVHAVVSDLAVEVAIAVTSGTFRWRRLPWLLAAVSPQLLVANISFGVAIITVLQAEPMAAWAIVACLIVLIAAYRTNASQRRRGENLEELSDFLSALPTGQTTAALAERVLDHARALLNARVAHLQWIGLSQPVGDGIGPLPELEGLLAANLDHSGSLLLKRRNRRASTSRLLALM
jgi:hypothetical protein